MKYREVITYKDYFEDFFKKQSRKVQDKIIKVLDILETVERVPVTYLKYIEGTNGLFEVCLRFVFNSALKFSEYSAVSTGTGLLCFSVDFRRKHRRHLRKRLTAL